MQIITEESGCSPARVEQDTYPEISGFAPNTDTNWEDTNIYPIQSLQKLFLLPNIDLVCSSLSQSLISTVSRPFSLSKI
jgi:hypothetical protein